MKRVHIDLKELHAAAKVLRKLRTYALIDAVKPYPTASICFELGIAQETCMAAIRHLVNEGLLAEDEDNGNIHLTPYGADDDLILPEELLYKPRFQGLIPAALHALDPGKDGSHFHRNIFIIAAFDDITERLRRYIRQVCSQYGLRARFADERHWSEQVWDNVASYAITSRYAVALFHRANKGRNKVDHNPNVAFEVGLMLAWGRPCCLLKDKSLSSLHTDLIGWLYRECDFSKPANVMQQLISFFKEQGIQPLASKAK